MKTEILHGPLRVFWYRCLLLSSLVALAACGSSRRAFTKSVETGQGSYYADRFAGHLTASGVPYRPDGLTAAHNSLPFGTQIEVTNVRTNQSVRVVVNDRGPHVRGRIVDVSKRAAAQIGLLEAGVAPVRLRVVRAAPPDKGR